MSFETIGKSYTNTCLKSFNRCLPPPIFFSYLEHRVDPSCPAAPGLRAGRAGHECSTDCSGPPIGCSTLLLVLFCCAREGGISSVASRGKFPLPKPASIICTALIEIVEPHSASVSASHLAKGDFVTDREPEMVHVPVDYGHCNANGYRGDHLVTVRNLILQGLDIRVPSLHFAYSPASRPVERVCVQ